MKGKGLIVITGCFHPGIENIAFYMEKLTSLPTHGVIGGFHLLGSSIEGLDSFISLLSSLNVKLIVPLHCTGDRQTKYLKEELGERVREGGVGMRVSIQ